MRHQDPIVEEVRAARDAIAKASGYDIDKIAAAIKVREARSGRRIVRRTPRRPVATSTRQRPGNRGETEARVIMVAWPSRRERRESCSARLLLCRTFGSARIGWSA